MLPKLGFLGSSVLGGGAVGMWSRAMQKCAILVWSMEIPGWSVLRPWLLLVTLLLALQCCALPVSAECSILCGKQNVSYPFGLGHGCGNSTFENLLTCNETTKALQLNASFGSYNVVSINYTTYIISVVDCLHHPWDCTELNRRTRDADHDLYWVLEPSSDGPSSCQSNFSQYKSNDCNLCEQQQRVCGYQTSSPSAECCWGKSTSITCETLNSEAPAPAPAPPPGPSVAPILKKGTGTKVVAAVVGAGGALLVTCICFLGFRRYKSWNNGRVKGRELRRIAHILSAGSSSSSGVTTFTYKELASATKNFAQEKQLGGGGFNTVYKGRLRDGKQVAVKKLNQANRQGIQQFMAEVTVLSQARHRNLVQLYGCCLENRDPLLVYEFVENGTLAQHLHGQQTTLDCITRLSIATEVAEALAYLHSLQPPIFHRDVKSTNILLDGNFSAKVGDFGMSRLSDPYRTHVSTAPQGTPGYLDPDYHQTYHLSDKSDVYSLGVVLMELITGKMAVDMSRDRGEINLSAMATARIQNGTLEELLDPGLDLNRGNVKEVVMALGELGFQCLAPEKDDRPSMRDVVTKLRSIQYLALAIPSPAASPLHPQTLETSALIKQNSRHSADWPTTESYPDFSHQLVGR